MPIFIAALLGGLVSFASSMVGRVLVALAIGYVTYTGVSAALSVMVTFIHDHLGAAPTAIVGVLTLLKVDVDVSILASAIAARLLLQGLTSGSITKMVVK